MMMKGYEYHSLIIQFNEEQILLFEMITHRKIMK
jgi:hypothetical protein